MQFKLQLSTLLLTLALGVVVTAVPVEDLGAKRSIFDDCFKQGYQVGHGAGCNSASGNSKIKRDAAGLTERERSNLTEGKVKVPPPAAIAAIGGNWRQCWRQEVGGNLPLRCLNPDLAAKFWRQLAAIYLLAANLLAALAAKLAALAANPAAVGGKGGGSPKLMAAILAAVVALFP
ncbi:hypothetical protein C8R43DRAFT_941186 [Mycena crocata]|nr:hypothetical protein C8R43DRAFT_941186 [Mycena crocata]